MAKASKHRKQRRRRNGERLQKFMGSAGRTAKDADYGKLVPVLMFGSVGWWASSWFTATGSEPPAFSTRALAAVIGGWIGSMWVDGLRSPTKYSTSKEASDDWVEEVY